MKNRISKVAYLNVVIVIVVGLAHEQIEQLSNWVLLVGLLGYALANGAYIQYEIRKQERLTEDLKKEKKLKSDILKLIPTGIMIVDNNGDIKFTNPSAKRSFCTSTGENVPVDKVNILNASGLSERFKKSQINHTTYLHEFAYENSKKDSTEYYNISLIPFAFEESTKLASNMLVYENVSDAVRLRQKLELQYLEMFKSFVKFIDAKDAYTGMHSSNVVNLANLVLEKLDMDDERKEDVRIAAALHDIGKIGIPERVLNKPGSLTNDEFEIMKKHPSLGANLLSGLSGYEKISMYIRHHHEKFNGNGYPDGLEGNEIPTESQIIAIADTYDAITTDRIYRKGRSKETAIEVLLNEKDQQFDSALVDIFVDQIRKH
tara:strand:- start:165 stop:1289 length:1125 start_codon:yes stop_codon:yes gene_type:complete